MKDVCKYPVIFVHGMFGWGDDEGINNYLPYWGANTCNIIKHYNESGFETHAASVGPASSAWDRACELYARLTGNVVDYGKVHSERCNHKRYGRYYSAPLIRDWDSDHKIHLIGHSFGGNTIRLFAHLLVYGAPEEMNGTAEDENLSELFKGGHADMLASVVTICAPHNGSTTFAAAKAFKILPVVKTVAYNYMGLMGRSPAEGTIFDFHLEQFGMSNTPGQKDTYPLKIAKKIFDSSKDSVEYDMSPEGAQKLNNYIDISPDIYYFSYSYNCVKLNFNGKYYLPTDCDFPFLTCTSGIVLAYNHFFKRNKITSYEERCNDGLVDLSSALHPNDEPYIKYNFEAIVPGVWNVMETRKGDHGTPIGLLSSAEETFELYDEIFKLLRIVEEKIRQDNQI